MIRPQPVVRRSSYNPNFADPGLDPFQIALESMQAAPSASAFDERAERLKELGMDQGFLGDANRFGGRMATKREGIRSDVRAFFGL